MLLDASSAASTGGVVWPSAACASPRTLHMRLAAHLAPWDWLEKKKEGLELFRANWKSWMRDDARGCAGRR